MARCVRCSSCKKFGHIKADCTFKKKVKVHAIENKVSINEINMEKYSKEVSGFEANGGIEKDNKIELINLIGDMKTQYQTDLIKSVAVVKLDILSPAQLQGQTSKAADLESEPDSDVMEIDQDIQDQVVINWIPVIPKLQSSAKKGDPPILLKPAMKMGRKLKRKRYSKCRLCQRFGHYSVTCKKYKKKLLLGKEVFDKRENIFSYDSKIDLEEPNINSASPSQSSLLKPHDQLKQVCNNCKVSGHNSRTCPVMVTVINRRALQNKTGPAIHASPSIQVELSAKPIMRLTRERSRGSPSQANQQHKEEISIRKTSSTKQQQQQQQQQYAAASQQISSADYPDNVPSELEKETLLCEGKTKQVYSVVGSKDVVLVLNKDRITAHNAQTAHNLAGKAHCSNVINAAIFEYLNAAHLPTSFLRTVDDTTYLATRCEMIPIEWVTRRLATGSFLKRNPGVPEGYRFTPVKVETFFKDDAAGDPEWSREQCLSTPLNEKGDRMTSYQYEEMKSTTRRVFEVLERAWRAQGCTLVDMKVEYGLDTRTGKIVLSDVIDNDSWRLWEAGDKALMRDKQVYRNLKDFTAEDMKKVKLNYDWVKEKVAGFKTGADNTVVVLHGSPSDRGMSDVMSKHCDKLGLAMERRVLSAHKVTQQALDAVQYYTGLDKPVVIIAVAGRSNGLGPVVSGNCPLPVINCPPVNKKEQTHDVWSSLSVPSGLGCSTVIYPETAVLHAASIFALSDHRVWARLQIGQLIREVALLKADFDFRKEDDGTFEGH